eukprot:831989-Prorocentrum_minimum.AAC.1
MILAAVQRRGGARGAGGAAAAAEPSRQAAGVHRVGAPPVPLHQQLPLHHNHPPRAHHRAALLRGGGIYPCPSHHWLTVQLYTPAPHTSAMTTLVPLIGLDMDTVDT